MAKMAFTTPSKCEYSITTSAFRKSDADMGSATFRLRREAFMGQLLHNFIRSCAIPCPLQLLPFCRRQHR